MERTSKLSNLRDKLSENIFKKIKDPKDRMLVALLYNVCNDMDPTRMQFIRMMLLFHQHGVLNNLNFLIHHDKDSKNNDKNNDKQLIHKFVDNPFIHTFNGQKNQNENENENDEEWTEKWGDDEDEDEVEDEDKD